MSKTKIICTIGPVTESFKTLKDLSINGMDIARLNFSHGTHESHLEVIKKIRKLNKGLLTPISVLLDTTGPEIRTKKVSKKMHLKKGDRLDIAVGNIYDDTENTIYVDYKKIIEDLKEGDKIMVDSGLVQLEVIKKSPNRLTCKVLNEGDISNKKHINLPGIKIDLPSITEKDKKDIIFGIAHNIDFIALSFVRSKKDIMYVRNFIKKHKGDIKIIAKIEDKQAVENIDAIIEVSDGVMVARGDLGIELPMEQVPVIQKKIIDKCILNCKPVIVATHLLESMIENPIPTRAEVTDITLAVWESTDAIMLSGETTTGKYPIQALKMMSKIAKNAEITTPDEILIEREITSINQEIARSASLIAKNIQAKAIIVPTLTGKTAMNVSSYRGHIPIYAFTKTDKTQKILSLHWGIKSYLIEFYDNPEDTIRLSFNTLKKDKKLKKGDLVVVVSNVLAGTKKVEAIEIREIL